MEPLLTEDTGRMRDVKIKARGSIGATFYSQAGFGTSSAGGGAWIRIGDWTITFITSWLAGRMENNLSVGVYGINAITGETIGNSVYDPYIIPVSGELTDYENEVYLVYGTYSVQFEATLTISDLREVFEVESHNEDELIGEGPNKWASWGYPNYGYFEAQYGDNPRARYDPVSSWVGGYTSGTEMAIGKYYERYSRDEETSSESQLTLRVWSENDWGGGDETITQSSAAPLTAYEGQPFTGYTYHINSTNWAQEFVGGGWGSGFPPENWFEADFEANGDYYPYELGNFEKYGYEGGPNGSPNHMDDPDYLVGSVISSGNRITIHHSGIQPETSGWQYWVVVDADIEPQGRISVKGKVLQPNGAAWSGACKLRALWKGIQIEGVYPSTVMKWEEEGQEINTGTDGTIDQEYGCSNIEGLITWAWWTYSYYEDKLQCMQGNLAIFHDQQDLIDKHQFYQAWRIMLQDPWKTEAFSVVHPMVATVDDFSTADLWEGDNVTLAWASGYLTVHATSSGALIHTAYPEAADCGFDSDSNEAEPAEYPQALNYQWKAWRYARVKLKSNTACTLTVKIKYRVRRMPPEDPRLDPRSLEYDHYTKEWDIAVTAGTTYNEYVIDLVAPDRFSGTQAEVDLSDWIADVTEEPGYFRRTQQIANLTSEMKHANDNDPDPPIEEDDVMDFVPHQFVGVGHIERLTFSGIPNNATVMFDKITVNLEDDLTNTDSEALLTISPVWQDSLIWALPEEDEDHDDKYAYHPEGKRIIGGLANFKSAIDVPYANFGGYKGTGFLTISDAMKWMKTDSTVSGLTLSAGYQPEPEDPHHVRGNDHYLAAWLSPILWEVPDKGDVKVFDYKIRSEAVTGVDTLTVEARAAVDIWQVYPGVGDPMGDYGRTFPLHFVSVLGSLLQGITYKKSTRKPIAAATVEVWQNSNSGGTLVKAGTFTSNAHHFWRSSTLRTDRLYEPRTALAKLVNTALTSPWWVHQLCKRQHWASVMGTILSTFGHPSITVQKAQNLGYNIYQANESIVAQRTDDNWKTRTEKVVTQAAGYSYPDITVLNGTGAGAAAAVAYDSGKVDLFLNATDITDTEWTKVSVCTGADDKPVRLVHIKELGILVVTCVRSGVAVCYTTQEYYKTDPTWEGPFTMGDATEPVDVSWNNRSGLLHGVYLDADEVKVIASGDDGRTWGLIS